MNAILINDTRSDQHVGCELVMRHSLSHCHEHGINVVVTIPTSQAEQSTELIQDYLVDCDLLLLNGEGSLHDDKPRALGLLQAAKVAKQAGLKTVIYNALWRNNKEGCQFLQYFDLIFCRDSASSREILAYSSVLPVQTIPDMIFATAIPSDVPSRGETILVTDAVRSSATLALAKLAAKNHWHFSPMGKGILRCLRNRHLLRWRLAKRCQYHYPELPRAESFIQDIFNAKAIITGRFHTACLALRFNTPVACIRSNTPKIESLYTDFGLNPSLIPDQINSESEAKPQWLMQKSHPTVKKQISEAPSQIKRMFQQIAAI